MSEYTVKKRITALIACLLLVLAVIPCAFADTYTAPEPTKITIALYGSADEMAVWNDQILPVINKNLEAQNITAEVLQVPADGWVQYYQKVMAMQAAGTAPDIGRISEFYLTLMIKKNQVAELTDKLADLNDAHAAGILQHGVLPERFR